MYCLNLLAIALELARENQSYQDVANKFFEHFLLIAHAMTEATTARTACACGTRRTASSTTCCTCPGGGNVPMRVRSMVGLIPLFAVATLEDDVARALSRVREARALVHLEPPRARREAWTPSRSARAQRRAALAPRSRSPRARARAHARRDGVPLAVRRARALARAHGRAVRGRARRREAPRRLRARRVADAACSAATRTGAARCGSRSTTSSSRRCRSTTTIYGDSLPHRVPDGLRALHEPLGGRERALASPRALFLRDEDGRRRRRRHGDAKAADAIRTSATSCSFYEYFHGDGRQRASARRTRPAGPRSSRSSSSRARCGTPSGTTSARGNAAQKPCACIASAFSLRALVALVGRRAPRASRGRRRGPAHLASRPPRGASSRRRAVTMAACAEQRLLRALRAPCRRRRSGRR